MAATTDLEADLRLFTGIPLHAVLNPRFPRTAWRWLHGNFAEILVEATKLVPVPEALAPRHGSISSTAIISSACPWRRACASGTIVRSFSTPTISRPDNMSCAIMRAGPCRRWRATKTCSRSNSTPCGRPTFWCISTAKRQPLSKSSFRTGGTRCFIPLSTPCRRGLAAAIRLSSPAPIPPISSASSGF